MRVVWYLHGILALAALLVATVLLVPEDRVPSMLQGPQLGMQERPIAGAARFLSPEYPVTDEGLELSRQVIREKYLDQISDLKSERKKLQEQLLLKKKKEG